MKSAIILLLLAQTSVSALECYTGYAIIRGRTVGTETKTCEKSSDMCYKANADMNTLIKLKLAGCSTWRCMLSSNGCTMHSVGGQSIELCCCSGDLCNAPESNTESLLKGLVTHFTGSGGSGGSSNDSPARNHDDDSWRDRDSDRDRENDRDRDSSRGRDRGRDEDENRGSEVNLDDDRRGGDRDSDNGGRRNDDRSGENSGGSSGFLSKFFG